MGTSGNRTGYKVFSINTTVRNPQRNLEFLKHFQNFSGLIFDDKIARLYFIELVKNGVYKFSNLSSNIKDKILNDEPLSDDEAGMLIAKNPQATGLRGRVMTQLRSLKDQGFLIFEKNRKNLKISLTIFAYELLERKALITDIYSKLMLGLHSNNPTRISILNQSRVFLNTLFVIDNLKKEWSKLGNDAKGILKHEFKSFVLGMKDCDYQKCVQEILAYRKIYNLTENKAFLSTYLFEKQNLIRVSYNTLDDYADDVFRKFEMTGLIRTRGAFKNIYYDFSDFNLAKVESILRAYKNYHFKVFQTQEEYINFLYNIKLPWQDSKEVQIKVLKQKAKTLNLSLEMQDFRDLKNLEENINKEFKTQVIQKVANENDLETLIEELKILADLSNQKSKFEEIAEPLRLEYLLALILAKKYGFTNLSSNLIYSENGLPLSYAPAFKTDLEYEEFLIEATMIKNKNQQLNSETTSIIRHMQENEQKKGIKLKTFLIAPYIHFDVALFFKFCAKEFDSQITALSIAKFIEILEHSADFNSFRQNYQNLVKKLLQEKTKDYIDSINF